MKYLAQIWTGALTVGTLMLAGAGAASASHINNANQRPVQNRSRIVRTISRPVQSGNYQAAHQFKRSTNYYHVNQINNGPRHLNRNRVCRVAKSKLGRPYVYGATGPKAFDCSGFTQYAYRHGAHVTLPRTAQAQYNAEKHISYRNAKAGNLVFFGYSPSSISHVGMYLGRGKMIDAQNRGVVIERVLAPWWHLVGCAQVTA